MARLSRVLSVATLLAAVGATRHVKADRMRVGFARTVLCIAALVPSACGVTPSADTGAAEAIVELGDAVNSLRQDNALLQAQIDSLRAQVARQDTLIARVTPH